MNVVLVLVDGYSLPRCRWVVLRESELLLDAELLQRGLLGRLFSTTENAWQGFTSESFVFLIVFTVILVLVAEGETGEMIEFLVLEVRRRRERRCHGQLSIGWLVLLGL